MADDTQKKKLEPLNLFPVSGKKSPKSSPDKQPKILPVEVLTDEELDRVLKEEYSKRTQSPRATENGSS